MGAILSIQSHVAYGHVGNSAAVFPLQRLGFEVWPVHTLQYSNHLGYDAWAGQVFAAGHVDAIIEGIAARGGLGGCDAVLSGYLGEAAIGAVVLEAVGRVRDANPRALYLCDPVMGDIGTGLYVREDIPDFLRTRALPLADVITPNQFELELLTGRSIGNEVEALEACRAGLGLGPAVVVLTSLRHAETPQGTIEMLAVDSQAAWRVRTPFLPLDPLPNGAGDLLAALYLAHHLRSGDRAEALEAAAAATYAVISATQAAGTRELQLIAAQDEIVRPPRRFPAERIA